MRQPIAFILLCVTLFPAITITSCATSTAPSSSPTRYDSILALKKHFKYQDLTQFTTDTFNFDTRPGHYTELDSASFRLLLREESRVFSGLGYDRDYLHAWHNRPDSLIGLTILTQEESSYCELVYYYTFNKKGERMGRFLLAANCGDAGWTYHAFGRQTGPNDFETLHVEADIDHVEPDPAGGDDDIEKYQGDSIRYKIHIHASGKTTETEIWKKHFSK